MLFHKQIKVGELVRNKQSREVWLVVGKNAQGLLVVNLMLRDTPAQIHMILPGFADHWQSDSDIDDLDKWEADMIKKNMPLVDTIEEIADDELEEFDTIIEETGQI